MTRLLARREFGDGDEDDRSDTFAEATPVLAGLAEASVLRAGEHPVDWTVKWNMTVPGATYENTVDNRAWTT